MISATDHDQWGDKIIRGGSGGGGSGGGGGQGDSRHVDHVSVCGGSIPEQNRACEWELDRLRDRPGDSSLK